MIDWDSLFQEDIANGKKDSANWLVEMKFALMLYCWSFVRRCLVGFLVAYLLMSNSMSPFIIL